MLTLIIVAIVIGIIDILIVIGANKNCTDFINLSEIVITDDFKKHPPRAEKMNAKMKYLLTTGDYEQPIVVNSKNELIDGYTTYLIALSTDIPPTIIKIEEME